jgi:hypothetical protein
MGIYIGKTATDAKIIDYTKSFAYMNSKKICWQATGDSKQFQ